MTVRRVTDPDAPHDEVGPVVARLADERLVELQGPSAEAELLLRDASPARLVLRLLLGVVLLATGAAGAVLGRDAWRVRSARRAPMAHIPAGRVRIGNGHGPPDERPEHDVTLHAYDIDLTEVTVVAYAACVKERRCTAPLKGDYCNWGKEDVDAHPINCVDHGQAAAYCDWVGKRLPTEKEWEHAARGDDERRFPWGSEPPSATRLNACGGECRLYGARRGRLWEAMYEGDDGYPLTSPVGSFPAGKSPFGLQDTEGNVREWTASPYCPYPTETCGNEQDYVIRGAGWANHFMANVEATTREAIGKSEALEALGFRCAR